MSYILLSDIKFNGKVLKAGTINELKDFDNIPALLSAKVITEYNQANLLENVVKAKPINKIQKEVIEQVKEEIKVVEEKVAEVVEVKAIEDEANDIGIEVISDNAKYDSPKKRGRPSKK